MKLRELNIDELKQAMTYTPETGEIHYLVDAGKRIRVGDLVKHYDQQGNLRINWAGVSYSGARVAWALAYGKWPSDRVISISGDPRDLKLSNLSLRPKLQNQESLTYEMLQKIFDYNPETGNLVRRVCIRRKETRKIWNNQKTYRRVLINGKNYLEHRLIWFWHHGYMSENLIDHIDRDISNNRIENLREASPQCNVRNGKVREINSTGVSGIHYNPKSHSYISRITVHYKRCILVRTQDFTEAVAHRLAAEQCLDWAGCDSNSPAYQYMKNYVRR